MKYYKVDFSISSPNGLMQESRDILSALAGEAGFETFEETDFGLTGYVQQSLFDRPLLDQLLGEFPLPDCQMTYTVAEAEDCDWNAAWEQEGFAPIQVADLCVIHDGRYLPDRAFPLSIEIDAHLAFGTGTHETTRMMVASILEHNLSGSRVLDCGTGTGILAIAALKHGASQAVGYDIDEWSVDNARHNAVLNHVDDRFTSLLGDSALLHEDIPGTFQLVMANINRNILLHDLPLFCQKLTDGGRLLLSGFYAADVPLLESAARDNGLLLERECHDGEWVCLAFAKR